MLPTDLQVVEPKPHQKSDTIPAHAVPMTSIQYGRLLGTAARWQETHCDSCTPTTSPPTTSAHPATSKETCRELQHKQPVWPEPKTRAVLDKHAAYLCRKATPRVIQTQSPCEFFALGTVHACSTHSQQLHGRCQNSTSTIPFVCSVLPCLRAPCPYLRVPF